MPEAIVLNDTTYAGDVASAFITRAVVEMDTKEKGCTYIQDGIKKKKTIPRIEVSNFMQKRKATPTSKGTVTVDGRPLVPLDAMLYYEFNPRDFESHWYAEQLQPQLLGRELPVTVENFMLMQTMKRLNEFWENSLWRGRIAYDADGDNVDPTSVGDTAEAADFIYFDGYIKKMLDDAAVIDVPTPVALTAANIRTKFQAALQLLPKALIGKFGKGGVKFMISYVDWQKYDQALREDSFKNQNTSETAPFKFAGYDVVPLAGLPENTFVLCVAKPDMDSNLWVGINSVSDEQLQLRQLQANSELYFVKGLFKIDVNHGFGDQVVLYSTLTL